jgi:hypothetical protein
MAAGTIIGSGGVAWGMVKATLNGTKDRVVRISDMLDEHVKADTKAQFELIDRLARIETKLDDLRG